MESPTQPAQTSAPRRLLAATDFSPHSLAAVHQAYELAGSGGSVHLVHVLFVEPWPNPLYAHYTPGERSTPEERARLTRDCEQQLRSLVPEHAQARGIQTHIEVIESDDPAQAICAAAERHDVDLVCLATHGRTGLLGVLLGSVSNGVVRHCKRPVLLVPAQAA